ncbi:MAG: BTAD domain-containing putative transcriptional regulator [Solirubrobacteraceae bacterium]
MAFAILGPVQIVASERVLPGGTAQQRAVLALLIIDAPAPVSTDRLVDQLWGERPPATAQHAIQVHVSAIRRLLRDAGGEREVALRTTPAGYALQVDPSQIDARRFEGLLEESQRLLVDAPQAARALLDQALSLWRGPALADLRDSDIAREEAERLDELRALALERQAEARIGCGEHVEAIGAITRLVASNPVRERPRLLLMLALYRSGRQAEALAAYRDACAALDEIGLQPGPELRELEAAILRHDASLRPEIVAGELAERRAPHAPELPADAPGRPADGPERPADAPRRPARKVVTALLVEVTASSEDGDELDPEALGAIFDRCFEAIRTSAESHGGTVERIPGAAAIAVFGIPVVREDDALRAVRAAAEIRERLPEAAPEISATVRLRAAITTGVVLSDGGRPSGDALAAAMRIGQLTAWDQIVLSEDTLRLVRDAVEVQAVEPLTAIGRSEPVAIFRLVGVDPIAAGVARHLDAPLVGRQRELSFLRGAWDRAVEQSGCHLFTLLGAAGVGKSRLVAELVDSVGDRATSLRGRCLHYGEGITFWPLIEALSTIGEPARPLLERLSGGGAAVAQELFWEIRRLLEALALERPLILHVDDLQWAQPMVFDLMENIVELSRRAPILLLCTARPELLEQRPSWGAGRLNATALLLEPLDADDSAQLLEQLGGGLEHDARARVIAASGGNPLFLEEMTALARERGTVAVPATIQALLAARLERLGGEERELLECGAVEGEVFHRMAVCWLAGELPVPSVEPSLARLVREDLIRPQPATLPADEAFRFRHLLIRDAAYDRLPKAARAELHERFASWLEEAGGLAELDHIAGWHLEQAVRYQRELQRPADPAVARRAAEHLYAASQRADERRDTSACRTLRERALALAPPAEAIAARIRVDLVGTMLEAGELARAGELVEQLSGVEEEPSVAALARLYRHEWLAHSCPDLVTETIESILPAVLESLARAGDERGLAKAHIAAWRVHWAAGQVTAAGADASLAAAHARAVGDEGARSHALGNYCAALIHGPEHTSEIRQGLEAFEREEQGPYLAASINRLRAKLCSLEGRFPEARSLIGLALDDCNALGMPIRAAVFSDVLVETEFAAGDAEAALRALQRAARTLEQHGERAQRSTVLAYLGKAHEALHEPDAARAAIELADQLTMPDDVVNYAITHAVRARLALADGDGGAAERWARSAVEQALRTEFVWDQADTRLTLAHVLAALERQIEAEREVRAALELYDRKGDRPGAEVARALLDQLS